MAHLPLTRSSELLVAGNRRRGGRMAGKAQRLRHMRGDDRRPIADDEQTVDRTRAGGVDDSGDGLLLIVKTDRDRAGIRNRSLLLTLRDGSQIEARR